MDKQKVKQARWSWEATGAFFSFAGGILAGLVGSVLTAITWIVGAEAHPWLRGLGTALFIVTIPLLIFAGYCLDWMERKDSTKPSSRDQEKGTASVAQVIGVAGFMAGILLAPLELRAQQTVFNVPTTDVLVMGKVYVELDISAKPTDSDSVKKFSSFVPRVVVGAGSGVEVGLNILGNVQPGSDSTTLAPVVKWKVYDGGDNGWAIAVGSTLFIPVRNRSYALGTYSYTAIQKTFSTKTRVGFGGYFFSRNVVAPKASRAGGQFTIEQPVTRKFGLQADWFTGKHTNGYFTPGGYFKVSSKLTGYAAYSIGNVNRMSGNHFAYFELGYNLN